VRVAAELELDVLARGADDPALVERAYRDVLAPSFTANEIPPSEQFTAEVANDTVVVGRRDGRIVAAAVTDAGVSAPVGLLSYLAVRPDQRGTGAGSSMMRQLREVWQSGIAEVVLGEVHDPRCWPEAEDERPSARLRFYERHGARLLTVPWVQPRLHDGGDRVEGMLLLVMWSRHHVDAVPALWIRGWTIDYFKSAEGVDESNGDPVLSALLARIDASDSASVVSISRLEALSVLDTGR
jgi:GNAT superfamily N-acetyltransferase